MARLTILAMAMLILTGASTSHGQDTDEVKRLKEKIELLEAKLEAANLKVEGLQRENEELKNQAAQPKAGLKVARNQSLLSDRLQSGTVLNGTYYFQVGGERGTTTLTITERDGNKVKGTYKPKKLESAEAYPGFTFEGVIKGNALEAYSVGSANRKKMALTLRGNALDGGMYFIDSRTNARVSFKLDY